MLVIVRNKVIATQNNISKLQLTVHGDFLSEFAKSSLPVLISPDKLIQTGWNDQFRQNQLPNVKESFSFVADWLLQHQIPIVGFAVYPKKRSKASVLRICLRLAGQISHLLAF